MTQSMGLLIILYGTTEWYFIFDNTSEADLGFPSGGLLFAKYACKDEEIGTLSGTSIYM